MIQISISDLQRMLREQKELVVENILCQKGVYNNKTDAGNYVPLDINEEAMRKIALETHYPKEFDTLKKYLPED